MDSLRIISLETTDLLSSVLSRLDSVATVSDGTLETACLDSSVVSKLDNNAATAVTDGALASAGLPLSL